MMSPNLAAVLAAAESLPVEERYELVDRLLQGLDDLANGGAEEPIPALSPAWRQEIDRRSAEYDTGHAETVSWEEIRSRWQRRGTAEERIDLWLDVPLSPTARIITVPAGEPLRPSPFHLDESDLAPE